MSKPIMTKTQAQEWLPAVRELREAYLKCRNILCPLCEIVRGNCEDCLWILFTRLELVYFVPCDNFADEHYGGMHTDAWRIYRLKSLKRWEKRLLAIIEAK